MNQNVKNTRQSEKGSAAVKAILVLVIIGLVAHAGFNYLMVWYEAKNIKQEMSSSVERSVLDRNNTKPVAALKSSLNKMQKGSTIPVDAEILVEEKNGSPQANVRYLKKVDILPFGLYQHEFIFNHTATLAKF